MSFKTEPRRTFESQPIPAELTAHDQKFQRLLVNRREAKLADEQLAQLENSGKFSNCEIIDFKNAIRSNSTEKSHTQLLELLLERTLAGDSFQSILDRLLGNQQP